MRLHSRHAFLVTLVAATTATACLQYEAHVEERVRSGDGAPDSLDECGSQINCVHVVVGDGTGAFATRSNPVDGVASIGQTITMTPVPAEGHLTLALGPGFGPGCRGPDVIDGPIFSHSVTPSGGVVKCHFLFDRAIDLTLNLSDLEVEVAAELYWARQTRTNPYTAGTVTIIHTPQVQSVTGCVEDRDYDREITRVTADQTCAWSWPSGSPITAVGYPASGRISGWSCGSQDIPGPIVYFPAIPPNTEAPPAVSCQPTLDTAGEPDSVLRIARIIGAGSLRSGECDENNESCGEPLTSELGLDCDSSAAGPDGICVASYRRPGESARVLADRGPGYDVFPAGLRCYTATEEVVVERGSANEGQDVFVVPTGTHPGLTCYATFQPDPDEAGFAIDITAGVGRIRSPAPSSLDCSYPPTDGDRCFVSAHSLRTVFGAAEEYRIPIWAQSRAGVTWPDVVCEDAGGASPPWDEDGDEGWEGALAYVPDDGGVHVCRVDLSQADIVVEPQDRQVRVSVDGAGRVVTTGPDEGNLDCRPLNPFCIGFFLEGTAMELVPTAAPGWEFDIPLWGGDCFTEPSETNPYGTQLPDGRFVFTVPDHALSCVANFRPQSPDTETLVLTPQGDNTIDVNADATTTTCGDADPDDDCIQTHPRDTTLVLTGQPVDGDWAFATWQGDCAAGDIAGATNSYVLADNPDLLHTCEAHFDPMLRVVRAGSGHGEISVVSGALSPGQINGGIDCGESCEDYYVHGGDVTLLATPSTNDTFVAWDCGGLPIDTPSVTVRMDGPRTCTGTFEAATEQPLTIQVVGRQPTAGAEDPIEARVHTTGLDCGLDGWTFRDDCSADFLVGTSPLIQLSLDADYEVVWGGDCADWPTTDGSFEIAWAGPMTCTLEFLSTHRLVMAIHGGEVTLGGTLISGEVPSQPAEWVCESCTEGTCAAECDAQGWDCLGCGDGGCSEVCSARVPPGGGVAPEFSFGDGWHFGRLQVADTAWDPVLQPDIPVDWTIRRSESDLFFEGELRLNIIGGGDVYGEDQENGRSTVCGGPYTPCAVEAVLPSDWLISADDWHEIDSISCGPRGGSLTATTSPITVDGPTDCLVTTISADPLNFPDTCPFVHTATLDVAGDVVAAVAGSNPGGGQEDELMLAAGSGGTGQLYVHRYIAGTTPEAYAFDLPGEPSHMIAEPFGAATHSTYFVAIDDTLELVQFASTWDEDVMAEVPTYQSLQTVDLDTTLGVMASGTLSGAGYRLSVADLDNGGLFLLRQAALGVLDPVPEAVDYAAVPVSALVAGGDWISDTFAGIGGEDGSLFVLRPGETGYAEDTSPDLAVSGVTALASSNDGFAWLTQAGQLFGAVPSGTVFDAELGREIVQYAIIEVGDFSGGHLVVAQDIAGFDVDAIVVAPTGEGATVSFLSYGGAYGPGVFRRDIPVSMFGDEIVDVARGHFDGAGGSELQTDLAIVSRDSTSGAAFVTVLSQLSLGDWSDPDADGVPNRCANGEGWDCPPAAACVPICGDGLIVGPEPCDPGHPTGPLCTSDCMLVSDIAVVNAYTSPILPPGVDAHFEGVTSFIVAELSSVNATLGVTCSESGGACSGSFFPSPPRGTPPMSEIPISFLSPSGDYTFDLTASQDGYISPVVAVSMQIAPGDGTIRCERASNGLPGAAEVRWFGFELRDAGGAVMSNVDFDVYDRRSGDTGWSDYATHTGVSQVIFSGSSSELPSSRTFLVIGVDRGTSPPSAQAPREFRYGEIPSGTTRGCTQCSLGPSGTCQIIPRF